MLRLKERARINSPSKYLSQRGKKYFSAYLLKTCFSQYLAKIRRARLPRGKMCCRKEIKIFQKQENLLLWHGELSFSWTNLDKSDNLKMSNVILNIYMLLKLVK